MKAKRLRVEKIHSIKFKGVRPVMVKALGVMPHYPVWPTFPTLKVLGEDLRKKSNEEH